MPHALYHIFIFNDNLLAMLGDFNIKKKYMEPKKYLFCFVKYLLAGYLMKYENKNTSDAKVKFSGWCSFSKLLKTLYGLANLELSGDDTKIMGDNSCPSRNSDSSEKDNEML